VLGQLVEILKGVPRGQGTLLGGSPELILGVIGPGLCLEILRKDEYRLNKVGQLVEIFRTGSTGRD
jgi:hypothetical protein